MMLTYEQLVALGYMTGEQKRVFLPFIDTKADERSYKEIVEIGWKQLIEDGLIKEEKPSLECEQLIMIMSEYLYKYEYLVVDHFCYAVNGVVKELTSYIEELVDNKFRLFYLPKTTMIAGIMEDNKFLKKFDDEWISEPEPADYDEFLNDSKDKSGFVVTLYEDNKVKYQGFVIDDIDSIIMYDVFSRQTRKMSASYVIQILLRLMKTEENEKTPIKSVDELFN